MSNSLSLGVQRLSAVERRVLLDLRDFPINDTLSIGLAWATVPIAVGLVRRHPQSGLLRFGLAADMIGVATTTIFTSLLISRRMTFEDSLQPILTGQALIGTWLILAGAAAWSDEASRRASMLASRAARVSSRPLPAS